MHLSIRWLVAIALIGALSVVGTASTFAQGNGNGNGNGNADHGCVTGNPSAGSECNGGPDDNQGKPGGGVGCAGGSQADRSEPCGRADGDGTLNNQGNVPGCTSQGNAVNHNPHCGGGEVPPPICETNCTPPPACETGCTPPPPGGCVSNCGGQPTGTTVLVNALPSTGAGPSTSYQADQLLGLLLAAVGFMGIAVGLQRRSMR